VVGRQSGVIRTAARFDCEMKKEYYITVVAEDGAPSDRANHYPPGTPNIGIYARYSIGVQTALSIIHYLPPATTR